MNDIQPALPEATSNSSVGARPSRAVRRRAYMRQSVRRAAWVLLVVLLVRVLDPLDIDESLTERVDDIVVRVLAIWYPASGQDKVTVVMIDDAYLKSNHLTWPIPLSVHGLILSKIQRAQPKSIFVDMVYASERGVEGSAAGLARLVKEITTGHPGADGQPMVAPVPVFLGDIFGRSMPGRRCSGRDLPNGMVMTDVACEATAVVPVRFPTDHATYPADVYASNCNAAWPTPAFAQSGLIGPVSMLGCADRLTMRPPLFVVWGDSPSARMVTGGDDDQRCRYPREDRTWLVTLEMLARAILLGFDRRISDTLHCRYTDTISASALFDPSPQGQQYLKQMISGRHVLIGTDMAGETDRFTSPIHGEIPGVYIHAMALDNLLVAQPGGTGREPYMTVDDRPFFGFSRDSWLVSLIIAAWIGSDTLIDDLGSSTWMRRPGGRSATTAATRSRREGAFTRFSSFVIRALILSLLLYSGWRAGVIELPAALEIAFTVFVIEVALKLALGVRRHVAREEGANRDVI